VVYVAPEKRFVDVRRVRDFETLATKLDGTAARRLHEQAHSEGLVGELAPQAQLRL
jgi:hypothetical protein